MSEQDRAEAWVLDELERARDALRRRPPGPDDLTLEQYEQVLRARAEACPRPTAPDVGLDLQQAHEAATAAGDRLCGHRGPTGHRADWRAQRVHVEVADDVVRDARRDQAPWAVRTR